MNGFYGRVLVVDLVLQKSHIEILEESILNTYLGGKGLGAYLLHKLNPKGINPFDPDNHLILTTGPAGGTATWGSSRLGVFTKSPLTGFFSESYSGGRVPEALNAAGFDAVILKGACESPSILSIDEKGAVFEPALDIWGTDTFEAERRVKEKFCRTNIGYKKQGILVIGPAGENQVRFAIIKNDGWRCAGRTGTGAVMGSKKVKAIVFRGNSQRVLHDPKKVTSISKKLAQMSKDHPGVFAYKSMGTPMMVKIMNSAGAFPSGYWKRGVCNHWEKISADALHTQCDVSPHACAKCFMACGRMTRVTTGRHKGLKLEGPEYETIYSFGGLCGVDAIEEIIYLNHVCDSLGMDTITAGNLCAFALEAGIKGKIDLTRLNAEKIAEILEDIAAQKGIGKILSKGIRHAAKIWDMEKEAVHVKGMEPAGYDPRVLKGMGLGYAVSDRGACHLRATFYKPELSGIIDPDTTKDKAELFMDYEDRLVIFDTLILCRFFRDIYTWDILGGLVQGLTGVDGSEKNLKSIAADISDLVRRFNIREGLTQADDTLPEVFHIPLEDSKKVITQNDLDIMKKDYYDLRGWNEKGIPTKEV